MMMMMSSGDGSDVGDGDRGDDDGCNDDGAANGDIVSVLGS